MTLAFCGIICLFVSVLAACRGRRKHQNIEPLTPGNGSAAPVLVYRMVLHTA
jgi:hypothetical protein